MVWPEIPWEPWRETAASLHRWLQIVGKYRLACTPWLNHSWHATFRVSARGLTTGFFHDGPLGIDLEFDLVEHRLVARSSAGAVATLPLGPMPVSRFYAEAGKTVAEIGGRFRIFPVPNEIPDALPFPEDHIDRPYDSEAVSRFFAALVQVDRVLNRFRTGFIGKASPVHLFWGSFDLAATRFSGRAAPAHPGGVPALPDEVTREAYSHEVSSAGFWPGGGGVDYPAFYAYAYPEPRGFDDAAVGPEAAFYHPDLREFVLPYDAVRTAADPDFTLMQFLETTFRAAAAGGGWPDAGLECPPGEPLVPRRVGVPTPGAGPA
jgi:hypothetical protein